MKFSLSWLGDFVTVDDFLKEPAKLMEALTKTGLEAEGLEDPGSQFKNVVVAEIKSVAKHPQAERLTLCQAAARDPGSGEKRDYSIVCGAKNHKAGDKAVLALPGAVLPGNFAIKSRKIRGEISEGMLASAKELGLDEPAESEEGILILPPETETGQSFASYAGLGGAILDLNVTPNRADCLSHYGLAREISCLFNRPLAQRAKKPKTKAGLSIRSSLKAAVLEPEACPRYCGRLIQNVRIAESPPWLKKRLKSLGLKSINNVVDATNYVLWDQGQPLHAFDRDKIQSIYVARSAKGERLKTLDDKTLTLTGEELTIRDKDRAIALAGVIGGMDSAVSPETKNIFLESAFFRPEEVRRSARRFGLQTDSSYRFSRGTDPESARESLDLACALIQDLAGGEVSADACDFYPAPPSPPAISISLKELEERLGWPISPDRFGEWMARLKCHVSRTGAPGQKTLSASAKKEKAAKSAAPAAKASQDKPAAAGAKSSAAEPRFKPIAKISPNGQTAEAPEEILFQIKPPLFRTDLNIKEDLIEEFARLEGYDKAPEAPAPRLAQPKAFDSDFANTQKLQAILRERGWYQAINYSFSDPDFYGEFLKDPNAGKALGEDSEQEEADQREEPRGKKSKEEEKPKSRRQSPRAFSLRPFSLKNPISSQLSLMKPLLAPGLFQNAARNFRHNSKWGQIFEISPVFYEAFAQKRSAGGKGGSENSGKNGENSQKNPHEKLRTNSGERGKANTEKNPAGEKTYIQTPRLGLVRWGQPLDLWKKSEANNLFHLKSLVETVLRRLGVSGILWTADPVASPSFFHPKQFLALKVQGRPIGFVGTVHPQILSKHKIPLDVALGELNLRSLWRRPGKSLKIKLPPSQPAVEKDLCFVIPLHVSVEEAKREMRKALGSVCSEIEIFDLYEKPHEKQTERSVSFRLFLTPPEGETWTEAELQECRNKAIARMRERFSLSLKT